MELLEHIIRAEFDGKIPANSTWVRIIRHVPTDDEKLWDAFNDLVDEPVLAGLLRGEIAHFPRVVALILAHTGVFECPYLPPVLDDFAIGEEHLYYDGPPASAVPKVGDADQPSEPSAK